MNDRRTGPRRTDDGTYPLVEEELAKVDARAQAAGVNLVAAHGPNGPVDLTEFRNGSPHSAEDLEKRLAGPPPHSFLIAALGFYSHIGRIDGAFAKACVKDRRDTRVLIVGKDDVEAFFDPGRAVTNPLGEGRLVVRDDGPNGLWLDNVRWTVGSLRALIVHGRFPTAVFHISFSMGPHVIGVLMTDTPTPGVSQPLCPEPTPAVPAVQSLTTRKTYSVWCPDDGDRPDKPNVEHWFADEAAERWVENHWGDLDHPDTVSVCVEAPDGAVINYVVTAEKTVNFSARKTEEST